MNKNLTQSIKELSSIIYQKLESEDKESNNKGCCHQKSYDINNISCPDFNLPIEITIFKTNYAETLVYHYIVIISPHQKLFHIYGKYFSYNLLEFHDKVNDKSQEEKLLIIESYLTNFINNTFTYNKFNNKYVTQDEELIIKEKIKELELQNKIFNNMETCIICKDTIDDSIYKVVCCKCNICLSCSTTLIKNNMNDCPHCKKHFGIVQDSSSDDE